MAKLLPCPRCGGAKGPDGKSQWVGYLSSDPLWYKCYGCKQLHKIGALDYNKLPRAPQV